MSAYMLVSMCLSDKEPPRIEAYWAGTTHVVLNIGGISLYVEPAQLTRLIGELQKAYATGALDSIVQD